MTPWKGADAITLSGPGEGTGGLRHYFNSASRRFVHRDDGAAAGYGAGLDQVEDIR
jgi:peptide-methionine (R)-S-oxide reductase